MTLSLRRHGLLMVSAPIALALVLAALLAPWIAPHDPYALDVMVMLEGPTASHPLGADELGRDVLSRTLFAAQTSLTVGVIAVLIGVTGGLTVGLSAAYFGGWVDGALMRLMDILFSFPAILLAVILMANLGTTVLNAMLAIGIIFIPGFARLTRAVAQTVQRQQFLEAAVCLGVPGWRLVAREILPNVIGPVAVEAAVAFSYAVLLESALSFLGLGAQPPEPSWGNMIATGRGFIDQAPWMSLVPGAALFLTVFAFNVLGDGLRDLMDPHLDD